MILKRTFGTPITFKDCAGFLHDGGGDVGVLMLPAWGFEEFTIHRGWASFADILAKAGFCCLRFDWPGAGDSLGDTRTAITLDHWKHAITEAAATLTQQSRIKRLVLLGHGIGGLMAPHFARTLSADALVVMAPQNEGRIGLRELDLQGKLIADFLHLPSQSADKSITVAGHVLGHALAQEIAALKLAPQEFGDAIPALTVIRDGTRASTEWPERLRAAGFAVTEENYRGYDDFLNFKQAAISPEQDFETVRDWLLQTAPPRASAAPMKTTSAEPVLIGDGFREYPLIFGKDNDLFGVFCRPENEPVRATVIFINSGDTYHIGWARRHVTFARELAGRGIASFRIDTAGIGESAPTEHPLFYNDAQVADVVAAIDCIEHRSPSPIMLSGLCSGGYASVQTAVRDPRVKGFVAVNPVRLALSPDETFEQILGRGTASMATYRRRALSTQLWKDVVSGRISLGAIWRKGTSIVIGRFANIRRNRLLTQTARQQDKTLRARGVISLMVYAENDAGLDELARYFGKKDAADYDNAIVRTIPDSEHNMTATHSTNAIFQALVNVAQTVENESTSNSEPH